MRHGKERMFVNSENRLRLLPRLDEQGEKIEKLMISMMYGDHRMLNQMIVDLRTKYEGALYSTWEQGIPS